MIARLTIVLALAAGLACAQPEWEISGTVVEPALDAVPLRGVNGTGVAGVEVTLSEFVLVDSVVTPKAAATVYTDTAGAFRFHPEHPGNYLLEARKEGYSGWSAAGPGADLTDGTQASVTLASAAPSATVQMQMTRPGELSGQVIDDDSHPVGGLRLRVASAIRRVPLDLATGADGSFRASGLMPGSYMVEIGPTGEAWQRRSFQNFTEEDVRTVDLDWEASYWPGAGDLRSVTPAVVRPGASVNVGTIRVRRGPYYRAHVSAPLGECGTPGAGATFSLLGDPGPTASLLEWRKAQSIHFGSEQCGKEFLVPGLRPGRYWFALSTAQDGKPGSWALTPVEITDQNVEVAMTLMPAVNVTGRVVAAEGSELPRGPVSITLGTDIVGLPGFAPPAKIAADGAFAIPNVYWPRGALHFQGLSSAFPLAPGNGSTHYVEAIRYNGVASADGVITLAPGGELEIVVGDQPASITGKVLDGSTPQPGALVALVRWPLTRADPLRPYQLNTNSGEDGAFQLAGVPPGEYRVLAVPTGAALGLGEPGVMQQLAERAERVLLERGGSKSVELKLVDPGR